MADAIQAPAGAEGPTSHTQNQAAGLFKLRASFPSEQIQHLPRLKCPACRNSRTGVCENPRHAKAECKDCGNYVSVWHLHLDYVGHAELTNRLLDADPLWAWEPVAFDQRGLPLFDENGGLWIRLTVCGHTRLGYGDSQGKKGPNAVKEAIGDALRNAAMRFGAALDLWAKSDLREAQTEHPKSADEDVPPARPAQSEPQHSRPAEAPPKVTLSDFKDKVARVWNNLDGTRQNLLEAKKSGLADEVVPVGDEGTPTRLGELLESRIAELEAAKSGERSAA
jgi:hypothetical protein